MDNDQELNAQLLAHLNGCSSCREAYRRMTEAVLLLQSSDPPYRPELTDTVMRRIAEEEPAAFRNSDGPMPVRNWLIAGIILLSSFILVTFSDSFIWLREVMGGLLEIPLSLILGFAASLFWMMFIGTHIDSIARFLGMRKTGRHYAGLFSGISFAGLVRRVRRHDEADED
jgi:predicted anti-sigma-YlaC factor YlaD